MPKPSVSDLQKAAQGLSSNASPEEKSAFLNRALEVFSQETERLEQSYSILKEHLKNLTYELEDSNQKLNKKVSELDYITHYLNSILSNISQGILFLDLNGAITTYNAAAEKFLEVSSQTVLFQQFWKNFPDDLFGFSMREALSDRNCPSTSYTSITTEEGTKRELEVSTSFVLKPENHEADSRNMLFAESTQGLIVLLHDITHLRQLQMLANRNDRMKELGEMAAMVAHEIRNPLGGIKGFATLLQRDLKDSPEMEQMASYIVEGTDHLNRLVTQVLNYARPVNAQPEANDMVLLMEDLVQHLKADDSFDHAKIKLEFEPVHEHLIAYIDPHLIKSALLNLLVNAIQAMPPEGGAIHLTLFVDGQDVEIDVKDTGIGIPKENLEKVFSPFFTTKEKGNGFGLSEVHKAIQAHHGSIKVDSEVGKGSTFTIRIPLKT